MPEMAGWLQEKGVERFGPALFKYNVIDMPELEMELGFAPPGPPDGDGRVISGVLPPKVRHGHLLGSLRRPDGCHHGAHRLGQRARRHMGRE
ncbi:MAG: hypothetical protein HY834_07425 [Devosia nanyangense]|uniref:Uncharacterized protein n=1 Tax=Devosia nanyangense TaxID=1228055 RepID=A0A933L3D9_9HYPH|nr:hypothetical protein [Devosia nanyangense]